MFSNMSVANKIKSRREKLGLKQVDLSSALQISPQAVSKWERGENTPDISVLVPLAKLLDVSVNWLLGYYDEMTNLFEATVFISATAGFTRETQFMNARDIAIRINGLLFQVTESVIKYDAVPVKYIGDGIMCFFSGPNHHQRAIDAALNAKKIICENLYIGLHSGDIYMGSIGHPDYASRDILGSTVNTAYRVASWACGNTNSRIAASSSVVEKADLPGNIGKSQNISLKGIDREIEIYEIICK